LFELKLILSLNIELVPKGRQVLSLTKKAFVKIESNIGKGITNQTLAARREYNNSLNNISQIVTLVREDIDNITNKNLADLL
jgi:hypothetical protein